VNSLGLVAGVRLAVTASVMACASSNFVPDPATSGGTMTITQEQIARSAANTAWEVLKQNARRYTYQEDRMGRPLRIVAQRGVSSMELADADSPLVIIDGARVTDVGALAELQSGAIVSIQVQSGIRGTGTQGTNASAGVIYIHTREASNP
jgi:hypothetical protein